MNTEVWQRKDFNYTDKCYSASLSSFLEDTLEQTSSQAVVALPDHEFIFNLCSHPFNFNHKYTYINLIDALALKYWLQWILKQTPI